ncbi:hypothetical protein PYCC9005_001913 [Savitreella phatthalungensis]
MPEMSRGADRQSSTDSHTSALPGSLISDTDRGGAFSSARQSIEILGNDETDSARPIWRTEEESIRFLNGASTVLTADQPDMATSNLLVDSNFSNAETTFELAYGYGARNKNLEDPSNMVGPPQMLPLDPRGIPFPVKDPHNASVLMSQFDNIAGVLRHRGRTNPKRAAFMVLDSKGKEVATITWDKLASRAEKVAQVIREKSGLYRGDRVALVFRDCELIDYTIALFGCFVAGVVAVPINKQDNFSELSAILAATQARLALTTDANLKSFHRDLSLNRLAWPRGVEWWKTNEFGSYHHRKNEDLPALQAPDLAYIEYSRSPTGELRGVVVSHRTIMHQMACLSAIVATAPEPRPDAHAQSRGQDTPQSRGSGGGILLSYLDPRQAIGMIMETLLSVYHGYTTVWIPPSLISTAGLFAQLITRYRATIILADYPGLRTVAYNYQNDPMATRGRRHIDFSFVKLCLVDCLTVDVEFHEIVADRWLRPLGSPNARQVLTPMLCLPEHGGMVISMKDVLGGHERIESAGAQSVNADTLNDDNDVDEVLLDKEALKANEINIVCRGSTGSGKREIDHTTVRVGSFWYPLADATVAIVDPETSQLCQPGTVGEIWIDSPSMSACYWLLPRHSEAIFHARPCLHDETAPRRRKQYEQEFLRTGLLGFVVRGKIYVLGLYEDRLRQKVEWSEEQQEFVEYRYHYVSHLVSTIMRGAPRITDCSAFDVFVNQEHLPIIIVETPAASRLPIAQGGPPIILDLQWLEALAEKVIELLLEQHQVRVYCVLLCSPGTAPRVARNGRFEIGNMLCRKAFERGALSSVMVKFAVERAVLNLPVGPDPVAGIWSKFASEDRGSALQLHERQFSGYEERPSVLDDRTSTDLTSFGSLVDIFQWRATRQTEELAICSIDGRGKEGKAVSWRKLDLRIAAVAALLRGKLRLRSGQAVMLMYSHSEDFYLAVHACMCLGITAIPMAPLDPNRLGEDVPALLTLVRDFDVKMILGNNETISALGSKVISQHLRHTASALKVTSPSIVNTSRPTKQTKGCRELGFVIEPAWLRSDFVALVWIYWSSDHRPAAVCLSHQAVLGCCKVQKETNQMSASRPLLGSIRSTSGLGFLHSCLLGMYIGCPTYYLSPVDFAHNPLLLTHILARYKIKDCYVTPQTVDYLVHTLQGKVSSLHEVKNFTIGFDNRIGAEYYARVKQLLGPVGLDAGAINATYCHPMNPFLATRAYMSIEPIELYLDSRALREGFVQLTNPDEDPFGLVVQDSGMVPVATQVAIVNPETRQLCRVGEFGEIWVTSAGNADGFHAARDPLDVERFNGTLVDDGGVGNRYARTGDLGFLYTVNRGAGGAMQTLFVLGSIGETFEVNGLLYFARDIEITVERCHRQIARGGATVFQAGGRLVLYLEMHNVASLSSAVPVIVNAVLNEHQIIVDTVAVCAAGDLPRSRLREKQRGRTLASWVRQDMKRCAIYHIRSGNSATVEHIGVPFET